MNIKHNPHQSTSSNPLIHPSISLSIHAFVLLSWVGSQWEHSKKPNPDITFPIIVPHMADPVPLAFPGFILSEDSTCPLR